MLPVQVVVLAKEPVPGRVKTRLTPPYTADQAAELARAALADTLDTVAGTPGVRPVLALSGRPGGWLPGGVTVIPQRGGGLDERIAAAFVDTYTAQPGPMIVIGMDTPQVTPALLAGAARRLTTGRTGAVYGPATDGGWWLLGLRTPDPGLIVGVPMSAPYTGAAQLARLRTSGLRVRRLPRLTDVDTHADAVRVARQAPHTRFAALVRAFAAGAQGPSDTGAAVPTTA